MFSKHKKNQFNIFLNKFLLYVCLTTFFNVLLHPNFLSVGLIISENLQIILMFLRMYMNLKYSTE